MGSNLSLCLRFLRLEKGKRMRKKDTKTKARKGNSLLEYALPLAILFVGGIGASFAIDIPGRIALFFQTSVSADKDGTTMKVKKLGILPQNTTLPMEISSLSIAAPVSSLGSTLTVSFTTSTGETISLPYVNNIAESIETAGANGTTTLLLSSLDTLTAHAEILGELDSKQINSLKNLANQGHRMALIEQTIETFESPTGSSTGLETASIPFEGKDYHKDNLANKVSVSGVEGSQFLDLYKEAVAEGALENPAMMTVVQKLVSDILFIGTEFASVAWMADSTKEIRVNLASEASERTNKDSGGICDTSGSEDTGLSCS